MKQTALLFLALSLIFGSRALADGDDVRIRQRNTADTAYVERDLPADQVVDTWPKFLEEAGALPIDGQAADVDPAGLAISEALALKLAATDGLATNPTLKSTRYTRAAHGGTAVGATETVAASDGNYHELIFDENVVITTTFNAASGAYQSLLIKGIQDGTGTNTATFSPVPSNGQPLVDPTPNAVTYFTVETTDGGTTTTVTSSVQLTHIVVVFDPDAVCDGSQDIVPLAYVGDDFPNGMSVYKWRVSFGADPTTEADLDLMRADAYIGEANSAVMDVLDTTNGASSESTYSNINGGAKVANGKVVYLKFGTAYTATGEKIVAELWVF